MFRPSTKKILQTKYLFIVQKVTFTRREGLISVGVNTASASQIIKVKKPCESGVALALAPFRSSLSLVSFFFFNSISLFHLVNLQISLFLLCFVIYFLLNFYVKFSGFVISIRPISTICEVMCLVLILRFISIGLVVLIIVTESVLC